MTGGDSLRRNRACHKISRNQTVHIVLSDLGVISIKIKQALFEHFPCKFKCWHLSIRNQQIYEMHRLIGLSHEILPLILASS